MAITFELDFEGAEADEHLLDFYDAAHALVGFQRSLAIVTHFVINNEIITQATSLENARILSAPPEAGSWKTTAVILGGVWALGTAPKDSPLGHVISSVYDYVISETLGVHVDYDESLGQTLEKHRNDSSQPGARESQLDSLIEKCEVPIKNMHRPVVFSETAAVGQVRTVQDGGRIPVGPALDHDTWAYVDLTSRSEDKEVLEGWVSSYNINTFKGRIYFSKFSRPLPFILSEETRTPRKIAMITTSLNANAKDRMSDDGRRFIHGYLNTSSTGRVKSIFIVDISSFEDA